jgi:hypothetical protein
MESVAEDPGLHVGTEHGVRTPGDDDEPRPLVRQRIQRFTDRERRLAVDDAVHLTLELQ